MPKVRVGIIGAGAATEWEILPVLTGPDLSQPPDEGAWWSVRATAVKDIRWQAATQAEVVAICDAEEENAARLAHLYRVPAVYSDWRKMLDETRLDAIVCERACLLDFEELLTRAANQGVRSVWFDEPPVADYELVLHLFALAEARGVLPWWARQLRHASAHRAARRLINRGEIGDVTALSLRWNTSFGGQAEMLCASNFAALDLIFSCAQSAPVEVLAREAKGATTLWLSLAGGATATAIFCGADAGNSALPRLEIVGTQGRFLVCESGRRLGMFQPRDAARWIEPPGLASHVSAANVGGVADDFRLFLAATLDAKAPHVAETDAREAARVLQILEAAGHSLADGALVAIAPLPMASGHQRLFASMDAIQKTAAEGKIKNGKNGEAAKPEYSPPLTLPLNL
jgi:predicted dehydrogenase